MPWLKEVENEDVRRIVRKMRENGTIEHSGAFLKDAQVNSVLSRKQKKKGKKNLADIAKIKNAQGKMKNANNATRIGEDNRKVA